MADLGAGLENGTVWQRHGITYACGWDANYVWLAASSQEDLEREVLDGTNYLIQVMAYTPGGTDDPPRSAGVTRDDGSIRVTVDNGGSMVTYQARNLASGFSLV
jgi:hypothetical protein